MSAFKNIIPSFFKTGNGNGNPASQGRSRVMHRSALIGNTLHRRCIAMDAALVDAESRLVTLRTKITATLSLYKQHHMFLRRVAYTCTNSAVPLHMNEMLSKGRDEALMEAFENVELAFQVSRLKARALMEDVANLVEENERLRELVGRDGASNSGETRRKAAQRWDTAERERAEGHRSM